MAMRRHPIHARLAIALMLGSALSAPAVGRERMTKKADPIATGFRDPPAAARPRVWWHWMNGNVTRDGIRRDLEWMKRVGIGGVQNFDAALDTPQVVDRRLAYMTPAWQDAFRYATGLADMLGLEFAIAASPGWSETGGPWVPPSDGIKKYVWSETFVDGDRRFVGMLAAPPRATGPFQGAAKAVDPIAAVKPGPAPQHYADTVVLALPDDTEAAPPCRRTTSDGGGSIAPIGPITFGQPSADRAAWLRCDYDAPVTLRSATLAMNSGGTIFTSARFRPVLEASDNGIDFVVIAPFPTGPVPQYTIAFPPVTARAFRIRFEPQRPARLPWTPAPGAIPSAVGNIGRDPPKQTITIDSVLLSPVARVHRFEEKAAFETPLTYAPLAAPDTAARGVDPAQVIDLTTKMTPDGQLDWTPPPGRWRILRFGYSLTGKENHPATVEATGLEVDKLDRGAVKRYLDAYLATYEATVGKANIGPRGIRALLNDSIEVGPANWTPALIAEFKARRGYDPLPWLPVLTGTIIGDAIRSDAFLHDFRQTLADLIAANHYGQIAETARERGLRSYAEALEFGRPSLGDDMAMRRHADVPMAAMWTYAPDSARPRPVYEADIRGAASVAHIYGQNIVAAESLTSAWQPWSFAPNDLKPMIDMAFALGLNLPVIHTSVHQPVEDKKPGLSLAIFGQHFNRHDSWAEQAKPWVDYLSRTAYLLQAGRSVADVLYFYGEEAPLTGLYQQAMPADAPLKSAYDFANSDVLMTQVKVDRGDLVTGSGQRYKLLWLGGDSDRMTVAMLRRIVDLAEGGATVAGVRPTASPGLADDKAAFAALTARLWDGDQTPVRPVGKGRIVTAVDADAALALIGATPDVSFDGARADTQILFQHRLLNDGRHLYFLTNRLDRVEAVEARFAVTGRTVERWSATTGTAQPTGWSRDGEVTRVPLTLAPREAVFVVFGTPTTAAGAAPPTELRRVLAELNDGWQLSFPGKSTRRARVGSWSESAEADERYFSGTATYTRMLDVPSAWLGGGGVTLDLGSVGDLAEVRVNGTMAGTAWHAPWQVALGTLLKAGRNSIEVRVTNLWVNRLVGDAQPGVVKSTFTTTPTYRADAPLRPSGLLGPVTLMSSQR